MGGKYDKSIRSMYRDLNASSYVLRNGVYTNFDDITAVYFDQFLFKKKILFLWINNASVIQNIYIDIY